MMSRSPLAAGRMMAAARRAFHSQAQSRFRSRLNHTIAGEPQMTLTPLSAAARNNLPRLPQELEPLLRQHYARDVETEKRCARLLANPFKGQPHGDIFYDWIWANNLALIFVISMWTGVFHAQDWGGLFHAQDQMNQECDRAAAA